MTLLAGREGPSDVTVADVEAVADRVTDDVVVAALAGKETPAYDWWKVLFALYPNSKPTHASRPRDRERLRAEVADILGTDLSGARLLPCTFCRRLTGTVWSKTLLPMFESVRAINTLVPGVAGWPVCRACRVALWALPYGAWVTQGSATVLTCDDPAVEREYAVRNTMRAARIRQLGFAALPPGAGPEAVVLQALREHAADGGGAATLWSFKNDNQEPWLRVASTRLGVAGFLRAMRSDPECYYGWSALRRALRRRDRSGAVTLDGATAVARLLFDRDGEQVERLPLKLAELARDPGKVAQRTLLAWRALCRLYLEVMYGMDVDRYRPAAVMLADWITAESTRGRFNEFRRAIDSSYNLRKLLVTANARLFLDGKTVEPINQLYSQLCGDGPLGWRVRGQLFFDVMAEMHARGVQVGQVGEEEDGAEGEGGGSDWDGDDTDGEEYA